MKSILKLFVVLACAVALHACGGQRLKDPVASALEANLVQKAGDGASFDLYTLECVDSTTFRTEFERRRDVFELKASREHELYRRYISERKPKNANNHLEAMIRANQSMASLDSLKASMEGRLDEIAYYEYVFSGKLSTKAAANEFSGYHFTIRPDGEIISMSQSASDVHKTGGRAIPGYIEMFSNEDPE